MGAKLDTMESKEIPALKKETEEYKAKLKNAEIDKEELRKQIHGILNFKQL